MNEIIIQNLDTHNHQKLKLSDNEAAKIRRALEILEDDLEMEMLHDQVVDAFWDYRNKVDYWRLRSLAGFRTQVLGYEVKSTLNRLAFNVLNLSKLFLDKHYHDEEGACFVFDQTGSPEDKEKVRIKRKKIYDENDRYLIGCKLRSRSQHGQLPVSHFSSGFKLRQADDKRFVTFNVTLNYDDLRKLKVPVSRTQKGARFDLTEVLDGYICAVSEMHLYNRTLTDGIVSFSRVALKEIVDRTVPPESRESCIVEFNSAGQLSEYIGLDRFDIAAHLRKKHPSVIDYSQFAFDLSGY